MFYFYRPLSLALSPSSIPFRDFLQRRKTKEYKYLRKGTQHLG
jgi:hypothetical protein